ncbi:MAG: hypothetical protein IH630_03070 [Thermoplasmata archaeon]|nr:hypothetical protein [Thermoplasmata archaeon]
MSSEVALEQLVWLKDNQLEPWYMEDVLTLEREWTNAAGPLEAILQ